MIVRRFRVSIPQLWAGMPQGLQLSQLLRRACTCSNASCFRQLLDHAEEVHKERCKFQELDDRSKDSQLSATIIGGVVLHSHSVSLQIFVFGHGFKLAR